MIKRLITILTFFTLLTMFSCATKSYYVKDGKFQPYSSRGLASSKVKIKYKNSYYYFDTVEEAEHFQTRAKAGQKFKSNINSLKN